VPLWAWGLVAVVVTYALIVAALAIVGRRGDAVAVARLVPDCIVLIRRLARDPEVPRRDRWMLIALIGYLLLPFDVVPDFVPVAGALDDAILVVWVLRRVLRDAGTEAVSRHWPGPARSLDVLLRVL
jgi:uncharacterized membrane protein YkvA (DUF1232 family)